MKRQRLFAHTKSGAGWLCLATALVFTVAPALSGQLPVRGVVRPVQEAAIATDLFAPVRILPLKEGDKFAKGDTLLEFNCAGYHAQRKAAAAETQAQQIELENKKVLAKHNAVGKHEIAISAAQVTAAQAKVDELDSRIAQCRISAPFAGRVAELFVNEHEMPTAGNPVIKIINDNSYEIELIFPSDWLNWLNIGSEFDFQVDETKSVHEARIIRFGAFVDPVSQTISAVGVFNQHPTGILAGMSGSATFNVPGG
jgi:RND family efflux transporter MFP subunit